MQRFLLTFLLGAIVAPGAPVSFAHAEEEEASPADAAKPDAKKKEDDVSGGRFAGDPIYIHIAPMVMPIISDQGLEQLITLIIDVEVKDIDTADNMHTNMPKVRDALMRALYGGLGQGALRNGKLVDVTRIKKRATAAIGEVVGVDNVREVLVQGVGQRML